MRLVLAFLVLGVFVYGIVVRQSENPDLAIQGHFVNEGGGGVRAHIFRGNPPSLVGGMEVENTGSSPIVLMDLVAQRADPGLSVLTSHIVRLSPKNLAIGELGGGCGDISNSPYDAEPFQGAVLEPGEEAWVIVTIRSDPPRALRLWTITIRYRGSGNGRVHTQTVEYDVGFDAENIGKSQCPSGRTS